MIGFAAPWIFGVALAAALTITALHFLSVRQPRVLLLPTARFVPERDARAVARHAKPSDVLLLLLRVIALLAAGSALAGARCDAQSARTSQLIVIDAAWRADSVALLSRAMSAAAVDSVAALELPVVLWVNGVSNDPGVAIAAAIRESASQAHADPSLAALSLTVVMPELVRSRRGWDAWRNQWPARIRVVRPVHAGATDTGAMAGAAFGRVRVMSAATTVGTDVVAAAYASRGVSALRTPGADVDDVVVRRETTDDATNARVTVLWPVSGVPAGWRAALPADSVGALVATGVALVAPWVRTALPPALSDSVRAIAWWSDGVAAAVERTRGTSCVREVAIAVAPASDLLLSPTADGVLRALRAPCGGIGVPAPKESAGTSGVAAATMQASASRFRALNVTARTTQPAWLATALLVMAFVALLAEHVVRREAAGAAAS
ncbi:BatA domain-containing protein [Gemmatimonas sp.]|uniref:BatA domain-containing protein n=1 Tax=Gemmatimonas sp. TaxID=1962908 RepID=UPI00286A0B3E|nr:BatA domain-containing protein [Gemmatimonas sp.]